MAVKKYGTYRCIHVHSGHDELMSTIATGSLGFHYKWAELLMSQNPLSPALVIRVQLPRWTERAQLGLLLSSNDSEIISFSQLY